MYTKPTVTKIGTITETTKGGYNWVDWEVMSKRGFGCGGGT